MRLNPFGSNKKDIAKKKPAVQPVEESDISISTPILAGHIAGTSVLKHIYTSEKSTHLIGLNQYVFKITAGANKSEVKKEVSARYNVKVKDVKVMNVRGKRRDIGRYPGTSPGFRKAIVVLEAGSVIQQAKP